MPCKSTTYFSLFLVFSFLGTLGMITKIGIQLEMTKDVDIFADDNKSMLTYLKESEEHYNSLFKYKDDDDEEPLETQKIQSDDSQSEDKETQKITSNENESKDKEIKKEENKEDKVESEVKTVTKVRRLLGSVREEKKKHKSLITKLAEWNEESQFTLFLKTLAGELDLVGKMFIEHNEVHVKRYRMVMLVFYSILFFIIAIALLSVCCGNYSSTAAMVYSYFTYICSIFVVLFYFFVLFYEFMMWEMVTKTMRTKNIALISVMMLYGIMCMSWTGKLVDCYIYHSCIDLKNKELKA